MLQHIDISSFSSCAFFSPWKQPVEFEPLHSDARLLLSLPCSHFCHRCCLCLHHFSYSATTIAASPPPLQSSSAQIHYCHIHFPCTCTSIIQRVPTMYSPPCHQQCLHCSDDAFMPIATHPRRHCHCSMFLPLSS